MLAIKNKFLSPDTDLAKIDVLGDDYLRFVVNLVILKVFRKVCFIEIFLLQTSKC